MKRLIGFVLAIFIGFAVVYLLVWPTAVDPVAWDAPADRGYQGPFRQNQALQALKYLPIGDNEGPEDVAVDRSGRLYLAVYDGRIVRLQADGSNPENWMETGGRPLGVAFDGQDNLLVADAFKGLLRVTPDRQVSVLADSADGVPIRYANNVDVAADGRIYFSDSSMKFGAQASGGTYPASLLDIMEHGGHGRLLRHDPVSGTTEVLLTDLQFANGVAMGHDQRYALVVETGHYRVQRLWLQGPRAGDTEVLVENLPGFPDNLTRGLDGRYWVGLISPRNALLDGLSDRPLLRRVVQRLPAFLRPAAEAYGHVVAFDTNGSVLHSLQDPEGTYALTTGATETAEALYVTSLIMPVLARLPREAFE